MGWIPASRPLTVGLEAGPHRRQIVYAQFECAPTKHIAPIAADILQVDKEIEGCNDRRTEVEWQGLAMVARTRGGSGEVEGRLWKAIVIGGWEVRGIALFEEMGCVGEMADNR